jgi:hypothetical protein
VTVRLAWGVAANSAITSAGGLSVSSVLMRRSSVLLDMVFLGWGARAGGQ